MKKNIHISIATPCHEKWSSFKPIVQGGFCSRCEKEVIDFTSWSEERLKTYFKNASGNACGRFQQGQLKVYEYDNPHGTSLTWLPVFFTGLLLLFSSQQSKAQSTVKPKPSPEQYEPEKIIGKIAVRPSSIKVSGIVRSPDENDAVLSGVNIIRQGTECTVTDAEGKFTLTVENPSATETLVFSYIGYRTATHSILATQNEPEIVIDMQMATDIMGEMVVVGGAGVARKWYSPRRWWWGVRRLF